MAKIKGTYTGKKSEYTGGGGKPLEGKYELIYLEDEVVENSSGTGEHLSITFGFADKKLKKRKIWYNLNLWHDDEQPREIAEEQFEDIIFACLGKGAEIKKNTKQLEGCHVMAEIESEEIEHTKKQIKAAKKEGKNLSKYRSQIINGTFEAVGNDKKKDKKKGKDKPF